MIGTLPAMTAATVLLQDHDPAVDAVESYVEGATGGSEEGSGGSSFLLFVGFLVLLAVVFLVVATRVRRTRSH